MNANEKILADTLDWVGIDYHVHEDLHGMMVIHVKATDAHNLADYIYDGARHGA